MIQRRIVIVTVLLASFFITNIHAVTYGDAIQKHLAVACRVAQVGTYSLIAATSAGIGLYAVSSQYCMTHCFLSGRQRSPYPNEQYSTSHFSVASLINVALMIGAYKTLAKFSIKEKASE